MSFVSSDEKFIRPDPEHSGVVENKQRWPNHASVFPEAVLGPIRLETADELMFWTTGLMLRDLSAAVAGSANLDEHGTKPV